MLQTMIRKLHMKHAYQFLWMEKKSEPWTYPYITDLCISSSFFHLDEERWVSLAWTKWMKSDEVWGEKMEKDMIELCTDRFYIENYEYICERILWKIGCHERTSR